MSTNDTLKTVTEVGVEIASDLLDVPIAGAIIDGIISSLWPESTTDVWDQIQADVANMINQALDQNEYTTLSNLLSGASGSRNEGLLGVFNNYLTALKDNFNVNDSWTSAHDWFTGPMGQFQVANEPQFLPLFVQVVNLRLALLKDGVLMGASWNPSWPQAYIDSIHLELKEVIYDSAKWVQQQYAIGLAALNTPILGGSSSQASLWQSQNPYVRTMTLTVWDFVFLWPYFDPDSNGAVEINTREIYSDLLGGFTNSPIGQPLDTGTAPTLPTLPAPTLTFNYDPGTTPQPSNYSSCAPISVVNWNQPPLQPAVSGITTWVQYIPSSPGNSPWEYTLYATQVSRAGAADPDPISGANPTVGTPSTWSTMPVTSARGGVGGGFFPYINWIQFVSNNDSTSVSPVAGNLYGSYYVENWAGPQPFVFTFPNHQLSNVVITQMCQDEAPNTTLPMPVAVIFGFRFSNSY